MQLPKTLNIGKIRPTFEGEYDPNRSYSPLCIVYKNNVSYESKKDVPVGQSPDLYRDTEYWTKIVDGDARLDNIQEQIKIERARINQFIALPEGSKINDYRLEDICVGADGLTYDSPGDAVREQIKKSHTSIYDNVRTRTPAIIQTKSGTSIVAQDSSNDPLQGLRVFGKTTQNGTPTPDAPVPLVSVGDGGSVGIGVYGKNLVDVRGLTVDTNTSLTVSDDGYTITVIGGSKNKYASSRMELDAEFFRGKTIHIKADSVTTSMQHSSSLVQVRCVKSDGSEKYFGLIPSGGLYRNIEFAHDIAKIYIQVHSNNTNTLLDSDNTVIVKGLRVTLEPDVEWEPYKEVQPLTLQTPTGLPGIPVNDESLANYTDADGQMWCADEVDLERGVYVQRIWKGSPVRPIVFGKRDDTGRCSVFNVPFGVKFKSGAVLSMSTIARYSFWGSRDDGTFALTDSVFYYKDSTKTLDEVNAMFAELGTNFEVAGVLAEPIETELTSDILSMYSMLHSNYPVTTVLNDAGAGMEMQYNADTKNYINQNFVSLSDYKSLESRILSLEETLKET